VPSARRRWILTPTFDVQAANPSVAVTVPRATRCLTRLSVIARGWTTTTVTVKFVELVAVPLGVVTRIGPVVAPVGTATVILVPAPFTAKPGAFTLSNETDVAPVKLVPLILTDVPTGPLVGLNDVIVGAPAPVTVKFVELVAVPSRLVTAIGPVVAPAGTVAVILCALSIVNVADVPLKLTLVTSGPLKLVPWIVTEVPTGPPAGENELIVGAAAKAASAPGRATRIPISRNVADISPARLRTVLIMTNSPHHQKEPFELSILRSIPPGQLVSIAPRSGDEFRHILFKIRCRICPAPEHFAGPEPSERHVLALMKGDAMNPFSNVPRRIGATVIASALVLVVAAATALGQTRPSHETSGAAQAPQSSAVAGAAIAEPAWCCATGSVPGITVTGQATIKDESTAARDAAIAEAVADAADQARAAADAAGTPLGEVLDMQVSAMPVVYPMTEAAPQPGVAVGSGSSIGGADPGATGPDAPVWYQGSATVTITWAIG
jgi:Protein of unknown function (DUF541)